MQEGMYLGSPPVRVGSARARAVLETMLRGSGSYGQAAGMGAPLALPQVQAGLKRTPANPQNTANQVDLYPLAPALFKLDLRRRFRLR